MAPPMDCHRVLKECDHRCNAIAGPGTRDCLTRREDEACTAPDIRGSDSLEMRFRRDLVSNRLSARRAL